MNRPPLFPPSYNPVYGQPQQPQQTVQGGIRRGLMHQSQNRFAAVRDALGKLDAGFSALDVEATNVIAQAAQQNPMARQQLEMSLSATRTQQQRVRRALEELMSADIALQDELSRWIAGQPPSTYAPQAPQPMQQYASQQSQYALQTWAPQGGAQGGAQAPQGSQTQAPLQNPALLPQIPPGQLDVRDPMQAAAAMLRAEHQQMAQMAPQYAQPAQYAQQASPYAQPGMQYAQPNPAMPLQVPVHMQYADPSQAGPAIMPAQPPVTQFASPEAAQAAVAASHAAGVPVAAVTATAAGPVSPAANGTAGKPATA
jgi:hypothetical protein